MTRFPFLIILFYMFLVVTAAKSQTYEIPGDFNTISEAVDAIKANNEIADGSQVTILLGEGVFEESANPVIENIGKSITLTIEGQGADKTTVKSDLNQRPEKGDSFGRRFIQLNNASNDGLEIVLKNLKFLYWGFGNTNGGGIVNAITDVEIKITFLNVEFNSIAARAGAIVQSNSNKHEVFVDNCFITNCLSFDRQHKQGLFHFQNTSRIEILHSTFMSNTQDPLNFDGQSNNIDRSLRNGGIITIVHSNNQLSTNMEVLLENNSFVDNTPVDGASVDAEQPAISIKHFGEGDVSSTINIVMNDNIMIGNRRLMDKQMERSLLSTNQNSSHVKNSNPGITIDPGILRQNVVFGGDAKLSAKGWAEGNTQQVANLLHNEMKMDILRIPLYAMRDADDPFYQNVVDIMNATLEANPDVRFFASVANGDGDEENWLHGAAKFPDWMKTQPGNIYNLNLEAYANVWDEYLLMIQDNDLYVNYVGPFNEDQANSNDYFQVFSNMGQLGDKGRVGVESWALQTAINTVLQLQGELDIVGSHFFDDETIPPQNWDSKWAELVNKSAKPVWFTEATRFRINDNIDHLIWGMEHMFPSLRAGVEKLIIYQTVPRLVQYNGAIRPKKYTGVKNLVNNAYDKRVVPSVSSDLDIRLVAFAKDHELSIHLVNKKTSEVSFEINLANGYEAMGVVSKSAWTASQTGTTSEYAQVGSSWTETLPAWSYVHLSIPLNMEAGLFTEQNRDVDLLFFDDPRISISGQNNIMNSAVKGQGSDYIDISDAGFRVSPVYHYTHPGIDFLMDGDLPMVFYDEYHIGFLVYSGSGALAIGQIVGVEDVQVPMGTSREQALELLAGSTIIRDEGMNEHSVDLAWEIDSYDGNVPGDYQAVATFELPEEVIQSDPETDLLVTATVTVMDFTFANNPDPNPLRIFPNPSRGSFVLVSGENIQKVSLYDVNGRNVMKKQISGKNPLINASGLPSGYYLVHVITDSGLKSARIQIFSN